jgi:hypothetical protein
MAALPLSPPSPAPQAPQRIKLQRAAAVARERIGALPGVRVLGAERETGAHEDGVRLAVDVRDTGRDGWHVACALAGRGIAVEAAGGRALVLRIRERDIDEGMHERVAPALLQALWSTPARRGFELALDPSASEPSRQSQQATRRFADDL